MKNLFDLYLLLEGEYMGIRRSSLKVKTLIIMIAFFLIPILIQVLLVNKSTEKLLTDKILKSSQQTIEKLGLNVADHLQTQLDTIMYYSNNTKIIAALKSLEYDSTTKNKKAINASFNSELIKNNKISRYNYPFEYIISDYKGNLFTSYTFSPNANYTEVYRTVSEENWFKRLKNTYTDTVEIFTRNNILFESDGNKIYFAHNIIDDKNLGIIMVGFDKQSISKLISMSMLSDRGNIYLFNEKQNYIIDGLNNTVSFEEFRTNIDGSKIIDFNSNKYNIAEVKIRHKNEKFLIIAQDILLKGFEPKWTLLSVTPLNDVVSEINTINTTNMLTILLYIVCIAISILLLNRYVINPILKLNNLMKMVTSGDLSVTAENLPNDEIGDLGKGFNIMVRNLNNYIFNIKNTEEYKRKVEIKLLQNQIKPHFVRNVLNIIRWLAEIRGADSISRSILAFSNLLEYNFKDTDLFTTVNDEIEYVKEYMYLQKLRYQNKFIDVYEIDEDILNKKILKLSFQPIVENSIYHGILDKQGMGKILIRAAIDGDDIVFTIEDNGIGIADKILESVLNPPENIDKLDQSDKIALWNINQRIVGQFGVKYAMRIESVYGEGTKVIIRFPII